MSTSPRQFYIGLYQEHLEEASFLYQQRQALFKNPEITWLDIGDFEERFEAHIDGLVVGGDLALEVCRKRAVEGDAGELHAAVRVFCRQQRKDLFHKTLEGLDAEDADKGRAWSDALCHELPPDWRDDVIRMLSAGKPGVIPLAARIAGFRRLGDVNLLPALAKTPPKGLPTVIWALGRLRYQNARGPLFKDWLKHNEEPVRAATALALLRLGEAQTLNYCLQSAADSQTWPFLGLGLGCGRTVAMHLPELASAGKPAADCLLALGLLGDTSAVPTLLELLANPEVAEAAALALHLITGARFLEEAFIPEKIDEDELFDEEREKLKKGESLPGPGGRPAGTTITRLSQKPEDWQKWWSTNRTRFAPRTRYRLGKPFSPACLMQNLESAQSSPKVRQLAYEELVIRYGLDVPFETELFVTQQRQALATIGQWVKTNGHRFQDGVWYFAGQLLSS